MKIELTGADALTLAEARALLAAAVAGYGDLKGAQARKAEDAISLLRTVIGWTVEQKDRRKPKRN